MAKRPFRIAGMTFEFFHDCGGVAYGATRRVAGPEECGSTGEAFIVPMFHVKRQAHLAGCHRLAEKGPDPRMEACCSGKLDTRPGR